MISRYCYLLALTGALTLSVQAAGLTRSFLADTEQAMTKMDAGMMAKQSGDVDHDFVQMMVPHHQAVAELRYGHNEQLKRIAQEIIVDTWSVNDKKGTWFAPNPLFC